MPTLREVQAAFAQGMLDPAFTARAASGIGRDGIAPERRLAIYRNNVLSSLRRVLETCFPATQRLRRRSRPGTSRRYRSRGTPSCASSCTRACA